MDIKEENNMLFSSIQIEDLSQDVFNELCKRFNITNEIQIFSVDGFSDTQGAYYSVFNKEKYTYEEAKELVNVFILSNK